MSACIAECKIDKAIKPKPTEHTEKQTVYVKNEVLAPKWNLDVEFVLHILASDVIYSIIIKEKEMILNKIV